VAYCFAILLGVGLIILILVVTLHPFG